MNRLPTPLTRTLKTCNQRGYLMKEKMNLAMEQHLDVLYQNADFVARVAYKQYEEFIDKGFSEEEALELVKHQPISLTVSQ